MSTILGQRCTVFLDAAGVQRFKIDNSIDAVQAGDLPIFGSPPYTSNVFVHKILNSVDPKSDTFLRVGTVADLTSLAQGREQAVGLGQQLYLSTDFTIVYDDIATASTAKQLIQQRVDNLIADWHTYNEKFLAPLTDPPNLSEIVLPLTAGIVSEKQDAYNAAHAAYLQAKLDAALATSTAAATAVAAADINERLIDDTQESQQITALLGHFNGGYTAITQYRGAVEAYRNASVTYATATATFVAAADLYRTFSTPSAGDKTTYDAAKTAYLTAKSAYDAAVSTMATAAAAETSNGEAVLDAFHTEFATFSTQEINDIHISAAKKKDADKAAAAAGTTKSAADAKAAAALLADSTTFLTLKEVCPTATRTTP